MLGARNLMDIKLKSPLTTQDLAGYGPLAKDALKAHEGLWIPVETEFMWANQFNTTIDKVGIRVHCRLVEEVRDDCRLGQQEYGVGPEERRIMMPIKGSPAMKLVTPEVFYAEEGAEPYQTVEMRMKYALEHSGLSLSKAAFNCGIPMPQLSRIRLRIDQFQRLSAQVNPYDAVSALNLCEYLDASQLGYCGMFATRNSLNEVFEYIERMSPTERRAATIAYGMTLNTVLNMLGLIKPE